MNRTFTTKKYSQFCAKILINCPVDEEIAKGVDVVSEAEVAADWPSEVGDVHDRSEGEDEDQEETESDLHRLHVTLRLLCAGSVMYGSV